MTGSFSCEYGNRVLTQTPTGYLETFVPNEEGTPVYQNGVVLAVVGTFPVTIDVSPPQSIYTAAWVPVPPSAVNTPTSPFHMTATFAYVFGVPIFLYAGARTQHVAIGSFFPGPFTEPGVYTLGSEFYWDVFNVGQASVQAGVFHRQISLGTCQWTITYMPTPPPPEAEHWSCVEGVCRADNSGHYATKAECEADVDGCVRPEPVDPEDKDVILTVLMQGQTTMNLNLQATTSIGGERSYSSWVGL